jgi:hypothetical protein
MLVRLSVLHIVLAALLATAYFFGGLQVVWAADHLYAIPIIGTLALLGLYWTITAPLKAHWLAGMLTRVGLAMTVLGLLWAFKGGPSPSLAADVAHSLVGNLAGIVAMTWLEFCLWVREQ